MAASAAHRILILGGGHAGLTAARRLHTLKRPGDGVEIALVSQDTALVWHGLLPQMVSNLVQPQDALIPLRQALPGIHLYPYEITEIDLAHRRVTLSRGAERSELALDYDYLVLALGSISDVSRIPGMAEHGLPLKTIGDAFRLRNHIIEMLELAAAEDNPDERRRMLTFVIAGSSFAGVELAAELNGLVRDALRHYPQIARSEPKVILLGGRRLLPALSEQLAARAQRHMTRRGVDVRLNARLQSVSPYAAVLQDGESIPTRTLCATVGNGPNPIVVKMDLPLAAGRITCDEFCRVADIEGVYAAGDCAAVPDPESGKPLPPTLTSAHSQGRRVADNILAEIRGDPLRPCGRERAQLALLTRAYGLVQSGPLLMDGFLASIIWRLTWLYYVETWHRRLTLLIDWMITSAFPRDVSQVHIARSDAVLSMRFGAGEVIVRQDEPGSRFYMIAEGEVEVLHASPDGSEQVIGKLGPGDQFGEVALLHEIKRTATVRALTDVQVISIDRRDFSTLVGHLPYLRESVERFANEHLESDVARRATQHAPRRPRDASRPPDP